MIFILVESIPAQFIITSSRPVSARTSRPPSSSRTSRSRTSRSGRSSAPQSRLSDEYQKDMFNAIYQSAPLDDEHSASEEDDTEFLEHESQFSHQPDDFIIIKHSRLNIQASIPFSSSYFQRAARLLSLNQSFLANSSSSTSLETLRNTSASELIPFPQSQSVSELPIPSQVSVGNSLNLAESFPIPQAPGFLSADAFQVFVTIEMLGFIIYLLCLSI